MKVRKILYFFLVIPSIYFLYTIYSTVNDFLFIKKGYYNIEISKADTSTFITIYGNDYKESLEVNNIIKNGNYLVEIDKNYFSYSKLYYDIIDITKNKKNKNIKIIKNPSDKSINIENKNICLIDKPKNNMRFFYE